MSIATPTLDGRSWALLLALALLWSVSFIFIKVAAAEIPVLTLVLVRVGARGAGAARRRARAAGGAIRRGRAMLARYAVMGLINNVLPFALIVYATARIGAGAASILNATAPIFALLVAHVVTADEKITPAKLVGILLGVGGVAAMAGPQALAGLTGDLLRGRRDARSPRFFYGVSAIFGRGFQRHRSDRLGDLPAHAPRR